MAVTRTNYLVLTAVLFLLGILGMLAYRANLSTSKVAAFEDRREQLVQVVGELESDRAGLQETLSGLRQEVAGIEKQAAARQGLYRGYTVELERLSMLAGLVSVQGPGLEVELSDNQRPPEDAVDPNNYIIHDYDVRILVNALWAGGAEAIAVNGQRVVESSAIRCVGATILVNNARVGSPFRIEAVGDHRGLRASLESDEDARLLLTEYAKSFGLGATVKENRGLTLPAYNGSVTPQDLGSDEGVEPVQAAVP